jgi:hypothetical protein
MTPDAFVVPVNVFPPPANVPLAPLPGAVNVTDAFGARFPWESSTVACSTAPNAVFTVVLCGVPPVEVIDPAAPAVFFKKKSATVATPVTDAVTVKVPANVFAVNAGAVIVPVASVAPVNVIPPPANVPLAPVAGAANITVTFGTGLLLTSNTVAWNCVPYCVVMGAL